MESFLRRNEPLRSPDPLERGAISHDRHTITFPRGLIITVAGKADADTGTTRHKFSHSFKGEQAGMPILPEDLFAVARELGGRIEKNPNTLLVSIDKGGTALGVAVAMVTGLPFNIAYSYPGEAPAGRITWFEQGAGKYLAIPNVSPQSEVVLIDDIIETGQTYTAAIKALRENGIKVTQILALAEVKREGLMGRDYIHAEDPNVDIQTLHTIPQPVYDHNTNGYIFPSF